MALTDAQATLASGGMQVGTSFISGILNYYAQKETNRQNYNLYLKQSAEDKAARKEAEKLAKANLALNTRAQAFNESESVANRAEGLEQKGYARVQSAFQRGADLYAQSMNILQAKAAPFQKYAVPGGR